MNYIKLTREKLCVDDITKLVVHSSCGAVSLFSGFTRDNFETKKVISLEYEAYEPMALKQMELIGSSIRERWPDVVNIAIYHRLGVVPVCEASVVIAVSSPHRKSSLDALTYSIDELKTMVPIWKKEKYQDEESVWKENKESVKKRMKLDDVSLCSIVEDEKFPKTLVQIAADENEIQRRIQCFIEKKREEINLNNIMDFTMVKRIPSLEDGCDENESTCARTNSVIIKQEESKCHLRVRRVKNNIGPQIRPDYLHTLDKLMSASGNNAVVVKQEPFEAEQEKESTNRNGPYGLCSRLSNIEEHLGLKELGHRKQIYQRIQAIENRLLYLESISPEYKHFLREKIPSSRSSDFTTKAGSSCSEQRKIYSVRDLDVIIEKMKKNVADGNDIIPEL